MERGQRGKEINVQIRAWALTQKVADVVNKGQALNVPLTHYRNTGDILTSELHTERPSFANVSMGDLGDFPVFVAPFRFSGDPLSLGAAIGAPGTDNDSVFGEILAEHKPESQAHRLGQPSQR
jgi:crotonobetainyl-CoA:carnitine CoA-transferase CaiB-like acyl-CoA transferase